VLLEPELLIEPELLAEPEAPVAPWLLVEAVLRCEPEVLPLVPAEAWPVVLELVVAFSTRMSEPGMGVPDWFC